MRDPKTYRAQRRNEPGNFIRLDGASWRKPYAAEAEYKTPSKKERYLANRERKLGIKTAGTTDEVIQVLPPVEAVAD